MSKDPAFLFYYKDFDNDTADWEANSVGWYIRLLIFQAGNGYIPDDIEELAQISRVKFSEYQIFCERWATRLAIKFKTLSDGKLYNPKLSKIQSERKSGAIKKSVLAVFGNYIKSSNLSVSDEKKLKNEFHKNESLYEILDSETRKNKILEFINSIMIQIKSENAKRTQQEDEDAIEDEDVNKDIIEIFEKGVEKTFKDCLQYFPEHLHPKKPEAWKDTIDKLHRIDGISLDTITQIVQKTRADTFWSKNFLSLPKLRNKNKEGIPYVIVFNEQIKQNANSNNGNYNGNQTSIAGTFNAIDAMYGDK